MLRGVCQLGQCLLPIISAAYRPFLAHFSFSAFEPISLLSGLKLADVDIKTLWSNDESARPVAAGCSCLILPGYFGIFKMISIPTAGFLCRHSV